jgi:hypothetical protein
MEVCAMSYSRFRGVCIIVALFTSALFLQRIVLGENSPIPAQPAGKCMMWKVSSKTATVYLLGSMHLATPQMYPLPREMEDAFARSDLLVVEINIDKLDQQKMAQLVQTKGMYAGDATLSGSIKKQTWQDLSAECGKLGLPPAGIEKMKPWLVGLTVEMMEIQKLGFDPTLGIDKHFLALAEKKGETIDELETADFQIDLLASFDAKMQEANLVLTLAELKELTTQMNKLTSAWIAGDIKAVEEQITSKEKEHPETREVMKTVLYDRNGPIAAKIETYLKGSKTALVIVGDAHMVGDKGILKILQKDKFKVEQSTATREQK